MQRGTTGLDAELPVKLTDEELLARGHSIAVKVGHVTTLRRKRREEFKATTVLIESEMDEIERLSATVRNSEELRRQGDLFHEQQPSTGEAAAALSQVAAHAQELGQPGEGQAAPPPALEVEASAATGEGAPADEAAQLQGSFTCATCNVEKPKADGVWLDSELRTVCPACQRAAVERGEWPHPYEPGGAEEHGVTLCAHCLKPEDHPVHPAQAEAAAEVAEELADEAEAGASSSAEEPEAVAAADLAVEPAGAGGEAPLRSRRGRKPR